MRVLGYKEADEKCKRGAVINARINNSNNKSKYSQAEIDRAIRVTECLKLLYTNTESYINYRKTKIAISLKGSLLARDKKLAREYEDYLTSEYGVVKTKTAQGMIWSIKKGA